MRVGQTVLSLTDIEYRLLLPLVNGA